MEDTSDYWLFSVNLFQQQIFVRQWQPALDRVQAERIKPALVVSFDGVEALWLYPIQATPPNADTIRIDYELPWLPVVAWIWTATLVAVMAWAAVILLRKAPADEDGSTQS
jgi:hypothetical protein